MMLAAQGHIRTLTLLLLAGFVGFPVPSRKTVVSILFETCLMVCDVIFLSVTVGTNKMLARCNDVLTNLQPLGLISCFEVDSELVSQFLFQLP